MINKIAEVEEAFRLLDAEITLFQSWSTLHCNQGCGKCCYKADLEATTLEFLPFAHFLYLQGIAFEWLDKLRLRTSPLCAILDPEQTGAGLCSEYTHRGLICRLFGYSARTTKYGKKELMSCQVIKTEQATSYQLAVSRVEAGEAVPVMNQFYMRLHSIDPELTREFFPINEAIKRAIEVILHYYAYRE